MFEIVVDLLKTNNNYNNNTFKKTHTCISIHSLCSIPCWNTFGTNYSLKSFWVWCNKLWSSSFGNYLPFFSSPLHLSSTFSGFSRNIWLGSSSGCGWATQEHSQSCLSYSCCVLRVIVLLEGKPSAQSEVLNALDWVFIQASSIFWCIELFFYSDVSLSPCRWKTAPQHEVLPAHFTFGMVLCRWWAELVSFRPFRCISANSKCVFMCLQERIEFGHTAKKPRSMECCSDVCPTVGFSHLHIWSWSSTRVTFRFLVISLDKALLHQLLSLARRLALGRDLGLFSWKILVLRVAPSNKILRQFLEMWVFPLKIKEKILVKKKVIQQSVLTLKRGLKVQNC